MKYGSPVIYVKNGTGLSGIVLTAQGDIVSILYADPASESLAFQGNLARIAQVARGVSPLTDGAVFGWQKANVLTDAQILQVQVNFGDAEAKDDADWEQKVSDLEKQIADANAQNATLDAHACDLLNQVNDLKAQLAKGPAPASAPEHLDAAQGPIHAGDPESPHAIETNAVQPETK